MERMHFKFQALSYLIETEPLANVPILPLLNLILKFMNSHCIQNFHSGTGVNINPSYLV